MASEGNTRFWSLAGVAAVIGAVAKPVCSPQALSAAGSSRRGDPREDNNGPLQHGFGLDHSGQ